MTADKMLAFVAACILSGCAHNQPLTVEQLKAQLTDNKNASIRSYPGKTPDQVKAASQKVLYLLDPTDMKFDLLDDQLLATRSGILFGLGTVFNVRDWYSVSTKMSAGTVESTFGLSEELNLAFIAGGYIPQTFKPNIPISANGNAADYKLFHDRVEYVLGINPVWPTCEQAKKESPDKTMLLCDSIGLENLSPNDKVN